MLPIDFTLSFGLGCNPCRTKLAKSLFHFRKTEEVGMLYFKQVSFNDKSYFSIYFNSINFKFN